MQLKKLCVVLSFSTVCFLPAALAQESQNAFNWLEDMIEDAVFTMGTNNGNGNGMPPNDPNSDSGPKQPDPSDGSSGG